MVDGGAKVEEVENKEMAKVAMMGVQMYTDSYMISYVAGMDTMSKIRPA